MVLAVLLLAIVLNLNPHRLVLHQVGAILRAMLGAVVVLELLLEVEAVLGALVLVNGRATFALLCAVHL